MSKTFFHGAGIVLGLGVLLGATGTSPGGERRRIPASTTPHFAFHSDFDTNLNDALIAAGVARQRGKPELFHSGDETSCFGGLPHSARAAWNEAVDYYATVVSPSGPGDSQQYLIRAQLVGFDEDLKDAGARQSVAIAASFRSAARPAYEACRWATQDAMNRRWIEEVKSLLAAHEETIAPRLEQLYRKRWGGLPIPVDIVETVNWSGANTILRDPAGGHLLISIEYQGNAALEVVFHEASHLLMDRGDPLRAALDQAAGAADLRLPGDFWHLVQFYTTGEVVRRILDDSGKPGYTPMVYGIFERGAWNEYRKALEDTWPAYLDGDRTLSEAAAALIQAVRGPGESRPDRGQPKAPAGDGDEDDRIEPGRAVARPARLRTSRTSAPR